MVTANVRPASTKIAQRVHKIVNARVTKTAAVVSAKRVSVNQETVDVAETVSNSAMQTVWDTPPSNPVVVANSVKMVLVRRVVGMALVMPVRTATRVHKIVSAVATSTATQEAARVAPVRLALDAVLVAKCRSVTSTAVATS